MSKAKAEPTPVTRSRDRSYGTLMVLASAAIVWERLWPAIWGFAGLVAVFVAVALLDVLPQMPGLLHAILLVAFVFAAALAARRVYGRLRGVGRHEARLRLERDSGLKHRPLTALEDTLCAGDGDPAAQAMWQDHLHQMAAAADRLRVRLPSPGMARIDPLGLRVLVPLLLVVGMSAGVDGAGEKIERAFKPNFDAGASGPTVVDVWLTPPVYTGLPPLFLHATPDEDPRPAPENENQIRMPAGTTLLSHVTGVTETPRLAVGEQTVAFSSIGASEGASSGYRVETIVSAGNGLEVRHGRRTLAAWPLRIVPDRPPRVQFTEQPTATTDAFLHVSFRAEDDYGVESVTAIMQRPAELEREELGPDGDAGGGAGAEIRLVMPLSDPGAASSTGYGEHDLTPHPWAGLEVSMHLQAEDGAGQVGRSPSVVMRLPERNFSHPVAEAVIAERKRLIRRDEETRKSVAEALGAIASRPQKFANDVVVSLALGVTQGRLRHERTDKAVASAREILWDIALRIEQGTVPIADRRLRQARQRLLDALRADAGDEEIESLMDELQRALDEYLSAVAAELARQGMEGLPPPPSSQMLRGGDLQELVDMARQMVRSGARDNAQNLISELQQILDGIRSGLGASRNSKDLMEAHRLLTGLEELADMQQGLLDRTYDDLRGRESQSDRGEEPGLPSSPVAGAIEQEDLRRALGDLMLQLDTLAGSIPTPLGEAERAMRDAAEALRANRLADAVPAQTQAVERLRGAAEAITGMLAQQLGGFGAMFSVQPGAFTEGGDDPFGRMGLGGFRGLGTGEVEIPDQMQLRQVEEILQELRRRAGEQGRPRLERNYIDRLLRRF